MFSQKERKSQTLHEIKDCEHQGSQLMIFTVLLYLFLQLYEFSSILKNTVSTNCGVVEIISQGQQIRRSLDTDHRNKAN